MRGSGITAVLVALVLLALVSAGVLTVSTLKQGTTAATAGQPVVRPPDLPPQKYFDNPLVILALDVSGSMRTSDAEHRQTEAVRQFLRMYHVMVRDALPPGGRARLAVVLFSTGAQVLQWPSGSGQWTDFLALPESPAEFDGAVRDRLIPFLGVPGQPDPRNGAHTDFAALLRVLENLMGHIRGGNPPCVVVMSDGADEPFVPFIASDLRQREKALGNLVAEVEKRIATDYGDGSPELRKAQAAGKDFMARAAAPPNPTRSRENLWDPPQQFDDALGDELAPYLRKASRHDDPEKLWQSRRPELLVQLRRLASRDFSVGSGPTGETVPFMVRFVYLGSEADQRRRFKELADGVAPDLPVRYQRDLFVACRSAGELPVAYMNALSDWLMLESRELSPGQAEIAVPEETGGLGIVLRARPDAKGVALRSPAGTTLEPTAVAGDGRENSWVFVASKPEPGLWRLSPADAALGGKLYARRRFAWAFSGLPERFSVLGAPPEVSLRLYNLAKGGEENPETIYDPASLPKQVAVTFRDQATAVASSEFSLVKAGNGEAAHYVGRLPAVGEGLPVGRSVTVDGVIGGLVSRRTSAPAGPERATGAFVVKPGVDMQLRNPQGIPLRDVRLSGLVPGTGSSDIP